MSEQQTNDRTGVELQGGNKYIEINVITEWRAEMRN